jgi:hypothetical protein
MNDEFDLESGGLDFEDPDFSFDEEEALFELEMGNVVSRTAVLSKREMIALLCVKTAEKGGAICRVDPREDKPAVQLYDDPEKAIDWFNRSLASSRRNGWNVVYDGLPLQG